MNPFVASPNAEIETTLARERLHHGIFILPVIAIFALLIPEIIFIGFIQKMFHSISQIGGAKQQIGLPTFFYVLILFVGAAPGLFALLAAWFSYQKSEITLTSKRLIFRAGFLSKVSGELPLENIEVIYLSEPLLGRILGYGTVAVTSVGGAAFPLRFIGSPQQFHSKLQQAVQIAKSPAKTVDAKSPLPPNDNSRYMPK
jgi:hypothetical protein